MIDLRKRTWSKSCFGWDVELFRSGAQKNNVHPIPWDESPDFGSVYVISSFLLQDLPGHDTRLIEVWEAFKRTLLPGVRAYSGVYYCVYREKRGTLAGGGPQGGAARNTRRVHHALLRLLRYPQQTPDRALMPANTYSDGKRLACDQM